MPAVVARVRELYRESRAFRWAVEIAFLFAIVLAISAFQTRRHLRGPLPALSLTTLGGERTSLAAASAGKRTLVYVWSPWCTVCKAESQNIAWVRSIVGDHANVVSIAAGWERVEDVRQYVAERGVQYPVLLGGESVARALRVEAFPTIYVIDAQGRISSSVAGYTTTLGLLARLLAA